jgi:hypothetical protein
MVIEAVTHLPILKECGTQGMFTESMHKIIMSYDSPTSWNA